jgi:hypothetical protein
MYRSKKMFDLAWIRDFFKKINISVMGLFVMRFDKCASMQIHLSNGNHSVRNNYNRWVYGITCTKKALLECFVQSRRFKIMRFKI